MSEYKEESILRIWIEKNPWSDYPKPFGREIYETKLDGLTDAMITFDMT